MCSEQLRRSGGLLSLDPPGAEAVELESDSFSGSGMVNYLRMLGEND
jgi:hypothetical protein